MGTEASTRQVRYNRVGPETFEVVAEMDVWLDQQVAHFRSIGCGLGDAAD